MILFQLAALGGFRVIEVGRATGHGHDERGVGIQAPVGSRLSLLKIVQTGSAVYSTSYTVDTGDKAAGA
jgi:hypothetical protein